jgi:glycosyltransferase involved in cell wall biosynthesis
VRVGLDATPLLGRHTGIGVYTSRLLRGLGPDTDVPAGSGVALELVATAFTARGQRALRAVRPSGVEIRSRPVPARVLRAAWARTQFPPVEWLCGRVDVFHGTNFVLPPTRRARGVVTVHDLSFLRFPETVSADSLRYRELVPRSIARAEVVCTLTQAMSDEIVAEYGLDPDTVQVTYPGVDEAWYCARPPDPAMRRRLGLPERYLLAVGTLEPRKNLPFLISAYAQLRRAKPETPPLVLAGPAGWGPALDLASLSGSSAMTTGYLDDDALRRVVAGAACLASPSVYEGFGLPPVEALACGVPVVATDLPVTREVLGDAARLVPRDDREAWADALDQELNHPPPDAAVEVRRAQARHWTWERCVAATRSAYRQAVGDD